MPMIVLMMVLFLAGCSPVEISKTIWGSSTRALEEARAEAISKVYDKSYWDCVRATITAVNGQKWTIFKKDEVSGYLVLMGIHGAVDTTEVGVFFVEINPTQTRIELSSLSTHAKRLVAKPLFHKLDVAFGLLPPDPVEPEIVPDTDDEKSQK